MIRWRSLEAVLFDLDNTLTVEDDTVESALSEALEGSGAEAELARQFHGALKEVISGEEEKYLPLWLLLSSQQRHWVSAAESLGISLAGNDGVRSVFQRAFIKHVRLSDDAISTIERVGARYALALVTNGPAELRRIEIEKLGIADYFETIIISGEVRLAKPDPQFFMQALADLGCRAGDALMVGDDPKEDVLGAKATGLKSCWLRRGDARLPDSVPPPDLEITSLSELLPHLALQP